MDNPVQTLTTPTEELNKNAPLPGEGSTHYYKELGPNDKRPPHKIPVLKILISLIVFIFFGAILVVAIYLTKNPDKYIKVAKPAAQNVEAVLSPYPKPEPNACGYEAKICPGGDVTIKKGLKCDFIACPDASSDMTKFWNITNSNQQTRTYQNLDLKYDFSIPSNWVFLGKDTGFILYSPNYDCKDSNDCVGSTIQMISSMTTAKNDIEQWYKSDENDIAINSGLTKEQLNNYKVGQIAGVKTVETKTGPDSKTLYFIDDNAVFILGIKSANENDFINGGKTFDNLVSSFKFAHSK